ncbi:MAG: archease [Infirmifilum sp.]
MGEFEILPHTADVLIKASGYTFEDALAAAIMGFYEVMTDTSKVQPIQNQTVTASGFDLESLLYNLIEALIILFDETSFLASRVDKIVLSETGDSKQVLVSLLGETYNPEKHESRVLIKAATYHLMRIWTENGKWFIQYVVDI